MKKNRVNRMVTGQDFWADWDICMYIHANHKIDPNTSHALLLYMVLYIQ